MQLYMLYVYNIFENSREERIRLYVLIYLIHIGYLTYTKYTPFRNESSPVIDTRIKQMTFMYNVQVVYVYLFNRRRSLPRKREPFE